MRHILADSFLGGYANEVTAAATLLLAVVAVVLVNRAFARRARRLADKMSGGELSREADTRLRFVLRLIDVVIVVVGVLLALRQFAELDRVASTILASSAIAAAVIGFAARQTLANAVAGIMLAVNQPLRIGDLVTFEGETGTVEDIGLTYTWLRTGVDARLAIPNERLAAGILRNDSIRSPTVAIEASAWIAPDADETAALSALESAGIRARVAEITHEGIRILVMGDPGPPSERLAREGDLRAAALRALRQAGVR